MKIYTMDMGDTVHKYSRALIVHLKDGRKVLSTAHLNGGYQEGIAHVMNFDSTPENGSAYCQDSETYVDDLKLVARKMELDEKRTVAISTTVNMEHVAIIEESYKDLTVTAIVTAGIAGNAARVGDPAWFHEENGVPVELLSGTINIVLVINQDLNPGTMARCIVTATEAKTAALQELMAHSVYSHELATGTGTDETIIVCNGLAKNRLMFAGKHSKLGELIGITVNRGVKRSLYNHAGLDARQQCSIEKRLMRFGFRGEDVMKRCEVFAKETDWHIINEKWQQVDQDPALVAKASLIAHLLDQMHWNLLTPEVVVNECQNILDDFYVDKSKIHVHHFSDLTDLCKYIMEEFTNRLCQHMLELF